MKLKETHLACLVIVLSMLFHTVEAAEKPAAIPCVDVPNRISLCKDNNRPTVEGVVYIDRSGVRRVRQQETHVIVICRNGTCYGNSNEYYGHSVRPSAYYSIPYDYYIGVGADGKDWAYKTGTGPDYDDFRAGAEQPRKVAPGTYAIWCNPQGDTCTTDQGEMTRQQLPKHYPYAKISEDDGWCQMELCFNFKGKVVGLNPDYSGF